MSEEIAAENPAPEQSAPKQKTEAELRKEGIQEYHNAKTREERADVVRKFPFLASIYSSLNHAAPLIAIGFFVLFLFALGAMAGNNTLIGSMQNVNGTANSTGLVAGTVNVPRGTFLISNGGLTQTNALLVNVQYSLDNTNWLTMATYGPSSTNSTTDTFIPAISPPNIYMRVQVVTTNSVSMGIIYQN